MILLQPEIPAQGLRPGGGGSGRPAYDRGSARKRDLGDCDERNTASANLLERLGFQLVKTVDHAYKEDADGNPVMRRAGVYRLTL